MTVRELIIELQLCDQAAPVFVDDYDRGYKHCCDGDEALEAIGTVGRAADEETRRDHESAVCHLQSGAFVEERGRWRIPKQGRRIAKRWLMHRKLYLLLAAGYWPPQ